MSNDYRRAALQRIAALIQRTAELFVRYTRLVPRLWRPVRPVFRSPLLRTLHATRGPLCAAAGCCAVLAMLPQAREIVRTLALDAGSEKGVIPVAAVALVSLAIGLWSLSWSSGDGTNHVGLRRALAVACAALPLAGASIGLWRAGVDVSLIAIQPEGAVDSGILAALSQTNALPGTLKSAAWAVAIGGLVTLAGLDLVVRRLMPKRPSQRWTAVPLSFVGLALVVLFELSPVTAPRRFGSIGVVLLFLLSASAVLTYLLALRDRLRVPVWSILLGLALLFAWLNISDNHVPETMARAIDAKTGQPKAVVPTVVALQSWLEARQDRGYFEARNQPYPIFIISAEGGGHYAAHLTATFLARAQDRCPNFAQHVFAVSSVSGGSIGAGIFAALSKSLAKNGLWQGCKLGDLGAGLFETRTKAILARDFLSPIVAATLFGDLPHAFLPVLRRHRRPNPLKQSYLGLWEAGGAAPALLVNTTQVENGMRVVVAPFMSTDGPLEAGTLHQRTRRTVYLGTKLLDEGWEGLKPDEDISLSTALGLSARFPWIMPAARFRTSLTEFRLVDGGYIDNSGDETAFDLIMELGHVDAIAGKLTDGSEVPKYQFHLITITDDSELTPGAVEGFGDLLSPLRTSRPTRSQMAKHRVRAFVNRSPALYKGTQFEFVSPTPMVSMNQQEFHIPLTWQLSEASRKLVTVQAGEAQRCGLTGVFEIVKPDPATSYAQNKAFEHINDLMRSNNCVACSIAFRLSGEAARPGQPCAHP